LDASPRKRDSVYETATDIYFMNNYIPAIPGSARTANAVRSYNVHEAAKHIDKITQSIEFPGATETTKISRPNTFGIQLGIGSDRQASGW
jgi:hypothetical protein